MALYRGFGPDGCGGFFYLVDRKDDLIISSGFNVYPSQIEEVLKKHPKIKDAAAIGIPIGSRGRRSSPSSSLKRESRQKRKKS